jgi:hypothetical protein
MQLPQIVSYHSFPLSAICDLLFPISYQRNEFINKTRIKADLSRLGSNFPYRGWKSPIEADDLAFQSPLQID